MKESELNDICESICSHVWDVCVNELKKSIKSVVADNDIKVILTLRIVSLLSASFIGVFYGESRFWRK